MHRREVEEQPQHDADDAVHVREEHRERGEEQCQPDEQDGRSSSANGRNTTLAGALTCSRSMNPASTGMLNRNSIPLDSTARSTHVSRGGLVDRTSLASRVRARVDSS